MPKHFLAALLLISFSFTMEAQEKELPKELQPFILQSYEMLDFAKGDLNGDKLPDYILILKTKGEDTLGFDNPDWEAARPLLLIVRKPGGSLTSVTSNTDIVLCRNCGGMMGDPYMGTTVKANEFSLEFYGGSSWKWGETITFRYDKIKKNWFLQTHAINSFNGLDPENTTVNTVINRNEAGDISLEKYTPAYNADTTSWKVNVAKTFFYESPVIGSKPKKAYLLKGDVIKGYKKFKNFVECTFENKAGTITSGFILRKDLVPAK